MTLFLWSLALLVLLTVLTVPALASALGRRRGVLAGLVLVALLGGVWWLLTTLSPADQPPARWSAVKYVGSASCVRCHPDHHESWYRTYHRTMTRDAAPETVKGDFADAVYHYQGLPTRLMHRGGHFIMETIDSHSALLRARALAQGQPPPAPRFERFRVDRLVGSHWVQECLHREANGRYVRLPVLYHLVEKRWVHANGAFLAPDSDDFWEKSRGTSWNDTCLYCHNTGPVKNPKRDSRGQQSYQTTVAELGISCEACHGPGGEHVRVNRNPARRLALQQSGAADASIVNPGRLSVQRGDEVCARCHGALVPRPERWDRVTHRDPFTPGEELTRYNHFFWSEVEQRALLGGRKEKGSTEPIDGRFWGDGTPLTTALEYNGMALSACYLKGQGQLSCQSCHSMHGYESPNFLLKRGMDTNEACLQCHESYRARLTEHTRHPAGSAGSLCYNCHMPPVVYSLLTTHRSHRIESPHLAASLDTGKPHACNLCHLDKSMEWTRQELARWPGARKPHRPLSREEQETSAALLHLARGDARGRAIVAGAFSSPAARRASGEDWFGPVLMRVMERERYPAVRYLAHRALRAIHGEEGAGPYDYMGTTAVRAEQGRALRRRFDEVPMRRALPHLPLTREGRIDEAALRRLFAQRHDPDLTVNE